MSQNRPFDLAKLDTEGIRKRKRKKLLLISAIPIAFLLIIGLKLTGIGLFNAIATNQYEKRSYNASKTWYTPLHIANIIEPYIAHTNTGNSLYMLKKYEEAESSFREALITVPDDKECMVRVNLMLSLEKRADAKLASKEYDEAVLLYDEARDVIDDGKNSCGISFEEAVKQAQKDDGDKGDNEKSRSESEDSSSDKEDSSNGKEQNSESKEKNDEQNDKESEDESSDKQQNKNNSDKQNAANAKEKIAKGAKRIDEKMTSAKKARNGDGKEGDDSADSDTPESSSNTPSESSIESLEKQQSKTAKKRAERMRQDRAQKEYDQREPRKYDAKNW